jgi:GNAT superfamily N-acetyltransferase
LRSIACCACTACGIAARFTNSYEEFSEKSNEATVRRFREQVASRVDLRWARLKTAAWWDGWILSGICVELRHKGYIVSMYVLPEYRSRGIARRC